MKQMPARKIHLEKFLESFTDKQFYKVILQKICNSRIFTFIGIYNNPANLFKFLYL